MAADDIYSVKCYFEAPSGSATASIYYQQTIDTTAVDNSNLLLANAFESFLGSEIRNIVCNDWWFPAIVARKKDGNPQAAYRLDRAVQVGNILGPSLPANNALLFNLEQGLFPSRRNGKIYWPPPAEADQNNGVISNIFQNGPVRDLAIKLVQVLPEESGGAGRWQPGVISQLVLNATPGFKDWAGAFAPLNGVGVQAIIATQRRRQTKVHGFAL